MELESPLGIPYQTSKSILSQVSLNSLHIGNGQFQQPWHLDRLDQKYLPLDGKYKIENTGKGVNVYIVSSGIFVGHSEFGGGERLFGSYSFDGSDPFHDCLGLGTHIAGLIGGNRYGVAKEANLHAVKVFNCNGTSPLASILTSLKWVLENHIKPSLVVWLTFGFSDTAFENRQKLQIIFELYSVGVTVVVGAGSNKRNACTLAPAGSPYAITVSGTNARDEISPPVYAFDGTLIFNGANYGPCIDVFAPNDNVLGPWASSTDSTLKLYGTNPAPSIVAGIAALVLETNPRLSPDEVKLAVINASTKGIVKNLPKGTPNRLANILHLHQSPTTAQIYKEFCQGTQQTKLQLPQDLSNIQIPGNVPNKQQDANLEENQQEETLKQQEQIQKNGDKQIYQYQNRQRQEQMQLQLPPSIPDLSLTSSHSDVYTYKKSTEIDLGEIELLKQEQRTPIISQAPGETYQWINLNQSLLNLLDPSYAYSISNEIKSTNQKEINQGAAELQNQQLLSSSPFWNSLGEARMSIILDDLMNSSMLPTTRQETKHMTPEAIEQRQIELLQEQRRVKIPDSINNFQPYSPSSSIKPSTPNEVQYTKSEEIEQGYVEQQQQQWQQPPQNQQQSQLATRWRNSLTIESPSLDEDTLYRYLPGNGNKDQMKETVLENGAVVVPDSDSPDEEVGELQGKLYLINMEFSSDGAVSYANKNNIVYKIPESLSGFNISNVIIAPRGSTVDKITPVRSVLGSIFIIMQVSTPPEHLGPVDIGILNSVGQFSTISTFFIRQGNFTVRTTGHEL